MYVQQQLLVFLHNKGEREKKDLLLNSNFKLE